MGGPDLCQEGSTLWVAVSRAACGKAQAGRPGAVARAWKEGYEGQEREEGQEKAWRVALHLGVMGKWAVAGVGFRAKVPASASGL